MDLIKKIHRCAIDGEERLQVICPECERHILLGEEDTFCPLCYREIEQTNIAAWTEYENKLK